MEDPRLAAEAYLEQHKLPQLFEAITSELLYHKPDKPREFIVKYLEMVKVIGTPPLLNKEDLEAMFGMFDFTKRGVITAEQANAALKSIMGPSADLSSVNIARGAALKKEEFVEALHSALQQAAAYKPPK